MLIRPGIAADMVRNKDLVSSFDLSHVTTILCGASVLLPEIADEMMKLIPLRSGFITQGGPTVQNLCHTLFSCFVNQHTL